MLQYDISVMSVKERTWLINTCFTFIKVPNPPLTNDLVESWDTSALDSGLQTETEKIGAPYGWVSILCCYYKCSVHLLMVLMATLLWPSALCSSYQNDWVILPDGKHEWNLRVVERRRKGLLMEGWFPGSRGMLEIQWWSRNTGFNTIMTAKNLNYI